MKTDQLWHTVPVLNKAPQAIVRTGKKFSNIFDENIKYLFEKRTCDLYIVWNKRI